MEGETVVFVTEGGEFGVCLRNVRIRDVGGIDCGGSYAEEGFYDGY